jgi:hypothetical protein
MPLSSKVELLLLLSITLYAVVSLLLVFLIYTYGRTFASTRARYPLGLLFFSLLLLVQSAGTALGYSFFGEYIGDQAYPFMFGMAAFELAGVGALLRITV